MHQTEKLGRTDDGDAAIVAQWQKVLSVTAHNMRRVADHSTLQNFVVVRISHDFLEFSGDRHNPQRDEQVRQRFRNDFTRLCQPRLQFLRQFVEDFLGR